MSEDKNFSGRGKDNPNSGAPDQNLKKTGAGTYLFALFAIAFLLLLMAHFMQERAGGPAVIQPVSPVTQQVQAKGPTFLNGRYIIN